jgi:acyl carrier protein
METNDRVAVDDVLTMVRAHVPRGASTPIDADTNLFELGFDSMGMISVIVELEDRFGCCLDVEDVLPENFLTVSRIVTLLRSKAA